MTLHSGQRYTDRYSLRPANYLLCHQVGLELLSATTLT